MAMTSFPCRCGLRIKPMKNFEAFRRILDLRSSQDLHLFAFQLVKSQMTQTTTLQALFWAALDMQLEHGNIAEQRRGPHCKSFFPPRLQCSSYRLLKSALAISLHIGSKSPAQHIYLDTTWKAGFALWSKQALKPVGDLQGKALPDYSFVCICYFPITDTGLLLWILTSIILIQCGSSTDFLICAIQKRAAVWNAVPLCIPLSFPCICCLIPEWKLHQHSSAFTSSWHDLCASYRSSRRDYSYLYYAPAYFLLKLTWCL